MQIHWLPVKQIIREIKKLEQSKAQSSTTAGIGDFFPLKCFLATHTPDEPVLRRGGGPILARKRAWVRLSCSSSQHHLPAALAELGNNRLCKAKGFHVGHLETRHRGGTKPSSPEACLPACRWGCGRAPAAAGTGRDGTERDGTGRDGMGWDGMQQGEACAQLEHQLESQRFSLQQALLDARNLLTPVPSEE